MSESLKRMHERLKAHYQGVIRVDPTSADVTHHPLVTRCYTCRDAGWVLDKRNPELIGQLLECPNCQAIARERNEMMDGRLGFVQEIRRRAGLMEMQPTAQQRDAYAALLNFANRPTGWIVLYGARGSGKTRLLAATILSTRAKSIGALFSVGTDLFELFKDSFGDGPDKGRFQELFERVKAAPVLAIDDLREIPRTDWSTSTLFRLLNDRYNAQAPTIVSMYESPDVPYHPRDHKDAEPNDAIRSRLRDRRLVTIIGCGSTDLRGLDLEEVRVDNNAF